MGSFGSMLSQFFATITVFFGAMEKSARAVDHLSTWAEESAGSFADEARETRKLKLYKLEQQRQEQAKAIGYTEPAAS